MEAENFRELITLLREELDEADDVVRGAHPKHFEALSEFLEAVRLARSVLEDALALG
jgi:hypothetical protein